MPFIDIVKSLVAGVQGGIAATIMGMDGLPIEQYIGASGYDVETVGVEYGKVIEEIKNASALLNLGNVEEVMVATAGSDVLLRMVSQDYYIAFVLQHDSNVGKARYLLKKAAEEAAVELA